jgi:hypothetical protein
MRKTILVAAVLLFVQIGLAVAFNLGESTYTAVGPNIAFLKIDPAAVSSIAITDKGGKKLVLQKQKSGWTLPGTYSAPASVQQVNDFLKKLAGIKAGLAVATTAGSAERFKTAKDNFERHLVLKQGDKVAADFYLGNSDGVHHTFARKSGENAVDSIALASYEVEPNPDKWLDKDLAGLQKNKISQIVLADITLSRKGKAWQLSGVPKKETNTEKVDRLVGQVCNLKVQSVLDPKKVAGLFDGKPAFAFSVKRKDGSLRKYAFVKPKGKKPDYYVLKLSDRNFYFKIYNWQVKQLQKFNLAALRTPPPKKEKTEKGGKKQRK